MLNVRRNRTAVYMANSVPHLIHHCRTGFIASQGLAALTGFREPGELPVEMGY